MSYLDDKDLATCDKCGRNYNKARLSHCPKCGPNALPKIDSRIPSDSSKPVDLNVNERVVLPNIDSLIRAQNRTTHAVRAFVRFLFIQLTGITIAVFLWNLSLNLDGNGFLAFLAVAVWIVSVIWSSVAGWDELDKSKID